MDLRLFCFDVTIYETIKNSHNIKAMLNVPNIATLYSLFILSNYFESYTIYHLITNV